MATTSRTHPHPLSFETLAPQPSEHRSAHLFSPINEAGSFEFDRVLKSGQLAKRRKRTRKWDNVRFVLRPNVLSIYSDAHETKLKHKVKMSEVSAVALRKDRNRRGSHDGVFGIFSPARNFHLEADSESEAQAWVSLLRREAHIDQGDGAIVAKAPSIVRRPLGGGHGHSTHSLGRIDENGDHYRASSDMSEALGQSSPPSRQASHILVHRPSHDISDPSGSEVGSFPEAHDEPIFGSLRELGTSPRDAIHPNSIRSISHHLRSEHAASSSAQNRSNFYMAGQEADEERVLWQGRLECLKTNKGVKQWKKYWAVLRSKNLALYKSEDEYAALLILPLSSILEAVETDSQSKTRNSCMQVITDDRSYRFSCVDEDDLSRWLGALKSTLAKRKDGRQRPA